MKKNNSKKVLIITTIGMLAILIMVIGTTYALMLQCRKIAVGYASKYNYVFHNNSIVNGQFTVRKLDMIDMTDKMASDVIEIYPALENAVIRRRVYARFSTLNQMLNEKDGYHSAFNLH